MRACDCECVPWSAERGLRKEDPDGSQAILLQHEAISLVAMDQKPIQEPIQSLELIDFLMLEVK